MQPHSRYGANAYGTTLEIFSSDVILSPKLFADNLADKMIDVLFVTTALFNQLSVFAAYICKGWDGPVLAVNQLTLSQLRRCLSPEVRSGSYMFTGRRNAQPLQLRTK